MKRKRLLDLLVSLAILAGIAAIANAIYHLTWSK